MWLSVLLALGLMSGSGAELVLAQGEKSGYCIVIGSQAPPAVRRGAREVQTYLEQVSGAKLPIQSDADALPGRAILVGPSRVDGRRNGGSRSFSTGSRNHEQARYRQPHGSSLSGLEVFVRLV